MGRRRPETPTLEEVAAHARVGRGTVSRVINNAAGVKESTRRAVQRAIEELGYVPNLAARSLAGTAGRRRRPGHDGAGLAAVRRAVLLRDRHARSGTR